MSTAQVDPSFEHLLEYLRENRAFEYTAYKRPTLMRRFQKRMQTVKVDGWDGYRAYLEKNPEEFNELFDAILINVTRFFRDPESWDYVAAEVVPAILEQRTGRSAIRVWSTGCASGEEPFTIAMLFAEAMGEDAAKARLKIYATDIDEEALTQGRHATYTQKQLGDVPEELRNKYFTKTNGLFVFRNDLRRIVIFGRNDLLQDPPISRVDFLTSRNTLMYFGAAAQERILANFYFALNRRGFLMLGKAEALQSRTNLFVPNNLKRRLFVKNLGAETDARALRPPERIDRLPAPPSESDSTASAFEHAHLAQLLVDAQGKLMAANHAARTLFALKPQELGRPLQDLEVSYRPLELRSLIDQVRNERRPLVRRDVEWSTGPDGARHFDVQLGALTGDTGEFLGVSVTFNDVTRYRLLHADLEGARRELETAYEELQSTVEELETTNEELQSTNEELETTNEELQSTNEELETMNEELQSTNEELETMNDELRDRTDESIQANSFLRSVLSSIHQSVIVVDDAFRIRAWSRAATELWGPREDEVFGEHLFNLDIGVDTSALRDPVRKVLGGTDQPPLELVGHNRRGQAIRASISFDTLLTPNGDVDGAILVVDAERTEG